MSLKQLSGTFNTQRQSGKRGSNLLLKTTEIIFGREQAGKGILA